jgi:integrase
MRYGGRFSATAVTRITKPGRYPAGDNLYLQVGSGRRSWIFRYQHNGHAHHMGLGPVVLVTLAEARSQAAAARKQLLDGIDPIQSRRQRLAQARLQAARGTTFKECAERLVAAHEAAWRNEKHRAQWRSTLSTYAYPVLGDLAVADVDTGLVLKVLEPIWATKPETAGRIRGRIEAVLDWAKARGLRDGDNPARWRGHLQALLPARGKVRATKHHAALPYGEIGAFLTGLRQRDGIAARALEFTILTAARTGEAIGARWSEVDMQSKTWTVPADRMKGKREHRLPLAEAAAALIDSLPRERDGDCIFLGARAGQPLSNMAMTTVLRRMGRGDVTVHGFRSSFRDWAAERTNFPSEVVEMALAHAVSSKVEAAYRRGDLFEKRRRLMDEWAAYCSQPPAASGATIVNIGEQSGRRRR